MSHLNSDGKPWEKALLQMKERLNEPLYWYPFPAIISFVLVMILGGHLIADLNPRLGSKVDVIPFDAPQHQDGGIWLGVYQENQMIHVITSDRKKFSWPIHTGEASDLQPFISYLKGRVKDEALNVALRMEADMVRTTAVIAVDQHLRYAHLRPIIYALAEARISRYGFETRLIQKSG